MTQQDMPAGPGDQTSADRIDTITRLQAFGKGLTYLSLGCASRDDGIMIVRLPAGWYDRIALEIGREAEKWSPPILVQNPPPPNATSQWGMWVGGCWIERQP